MNQSISNYLLGTNLLEIQWRKVFRSKKFAGKDYLLRRKPFSYPTGVKRLGYGWFNVA